MGMQNKMNQNNDDDEDDSEDDAGEKSNKMANKTAANLAKGKAVGRDDRRRGQDDQSKPDGSDNNDSQSGSQGQHLYDFQGGYGGHQPPPYNYQGYNYQMAPHSMGSQGYGMYQGYPPMGQRPPVKQYGGYSAYNYQDRSYPQMMGAKGMPGSHEYYDEYNYGENEMQGIRGHIDPQHGYPMKPGASDYMRQDKRQKPPMQDRSGGQYPPYQYGAQPINQIYPNVHQGHYDARSGPYDYSNTYKQPKSGEAGIPQGQANYYNYGKTNPQAPYSYGNYARNADKRGPEVQDDDQDGNPSQGFHEDSSKGQKKPQQAKVGQKPLAAEDVKANKVGKTNSKQFAEDLEKKKSDN